MHSRLSGRQRGQSSRQILTILAVAAVACLVLLALAALKTPSIVVTVGG